MGSSLARPQRLLWGSTSPKDPAYPDTYYIDALVERETIDTMTPSGLRAFRDHGEPRARLVGGRDMAHRQLVQLAELQVDLASILDKLEREGVETFVESYERALDAIAERRRQQGATPVTHATS